MREGGYHSFSFRQIADELGIKSASIHYHFPSKESLGTAVLERYCAGFFMALGDPSQSKDPISHYIKAFQTSLKSHGRPCLCCILAAESGRLPEAMKVILKSFTTKNIEWLGNAIQQHKADWPAKQVKETALVTFSALEGAMTFAAMSGNKSHLVNVGKGLEQLVE